MSQVQHVVVAPDDEDLRLDRWFRRHFPALKHGRLEKLLRDGQIRVDGRRVKSSLRLQAGQNVRVPPLKTASEVAEPPAAKPFPISRKEAAALQGRVLFRDKAMIVLNKPPGLAVQGGSGQVRHLDGLLDALKFGAEERPRLVHRLDKDTSGVLLLARNRRMAAKLTDAFRQKTTQKTYWALVWGVPENGRGRIDRPLDKISQGGQELMAGVADGKAALTFYQEVQVAGIRVGGSRAGGSRATGSQVTWLLLAPLSGRTHQLRAHCALMGHPIVGDGKYGGRSAELGKGSLPRQLMLLAREIALPHPEDGTTLRIEAPLPDHMAQAWQKLGFDLRRAESAGEKLRSFMEGQSHSPGRIDG
ncbi:MAG: RluA family pseudouridine synthase [Pseudomonadota bacterium]